MRYFVKKEITLIITEKELNLIILSLCYQNNFLTKETGIRADPTEEEILLNQLETFKTEENLL